MSVGGGEMGIELGICIGRDRDRGRHGLWGCIRDRERDKDMEWNGVRVRDKDRNM